MWHSTTALRSHRWIRTGRLLLVFWSLWVLTFGAYGRQLLADEKKNEQQVSERQAEKSQTSVTSREGAVLHQKINPEDTTFDVNLSVSDEEQVWTKTTSISLFRSQYLNEQRNESVRSSDECKVIAPGTQNQYLFRVENHGTEPIQYQIWYEEEEKPSGINLPIKIWLEKLNVAEEKRTDLKEKTKTLLQAGQTDIYVMYWEWLYERGEDLSDTRLGNLAVEQNLESIVKIHVQAELSSLLSEKGKQEQSNQEQKNEKMKAGIKTGDRTQWYYWCMVCTIAFMFSIFLYGGLKWSGYSTAIVMSGSMEPELKKGDLVFLEPVHQRSTLRTGDIIVYRSGKKRIVHRLLSVNKRLLRVKGDANSQEDEPIRFQQIEGRMLCKIRGVGKLFPGYRKINAGEKGIYGAFHSWSGQEEKASVAEFDLLAESEDATYLTLDEAEGTAVYSFTVTGNSRVNLKYSVSLELENGAELPEGVSYEIFPEQEWLEAGDTTPREHTVYFYYEPGQEKQNEVTEHIKIRITAEQTE